VEECKIYFHELNNDILDQIRKITSAQFVVWSYFHSATNRWIEYPIIANVEIENAYQRKLAVKCETLKINLLKFSLFLRDGYFYKVKFFLFSKVLLNICSALFPLEDSMYKEI
jgi:hypothetical protein